MSEDENIEAAPGEGEAAEAKPKPARKPRAAAKPKAEVEAEEAAVADEAEAPAEKPKRTRTAKPKADQVAAAEAPAAETPAAEAAAAEAAAAEVASAPAAEVAKAEVVKAEKPAKPSKPAPTRRREAREPGAAIPVVRAQAKYVRSSARKARLVCDNIRGKSVEDARAILAHTPRAVARDWSKLLESAVANAEHNHELVGEDLVIKAVHADEGPTIKRFRPRAMGRASKIRKRTAHLTILLTPKN
jgi:ribosomal protein L22